MPGRAYSGVGHLGKRRRARPLVPDALGRTRNGSLHFRRMKAFSTADLCDEHGASIDVVASGWTDYGGRIAFGGEISTVQTRDDNAVVRAAFGEPGRGRVLVVDGGGSKACALLGDRLAALARTNGWAGVVVNACIRDAGVLAEVDIGVKAIGTHPRKSGKEGAGRRDVAVTFGGVTFHPGAFLYADRDGIVVSSAALT